MHQQQKSYHNRSTGGVDAVRPAGGDISVVIPFYNREAYIDETIRSVMNQTLRPREIIIVNDCSKESSRRFLDRYADTCQIIDLAKNVGLAGARNAGIAAATGRFIAFLDDDDLWLPEKLEIQSRYFEEHPDCVAVHTAAAFFFVDKPEIVYRNFEPGPMTLAQSLTNYFWAIVPTIVMRSDAIRSIGGFDVRFRECEDRDFIIRCCAAGFHVEGINLALARVRRQNQAGLTKNHWRMFGTDLRMCWKHRAHYLRAYGLRGIVNFVAEKAQIVLQSVQIPGRKARGIFPRYVGMKYAVRRSFRDPVLTVKPWLAPPSALPTEASKLAGDVSV